MNGVGIEVLDVAICLDDILFKVKGFVLTTF